jgi:hypothetical protein
MNTATTHPVAPEEIMEFLDGELPADHARAIATHIEHCAECAGVAEEMRATSLALTQWTVPDAPPGLEASVKGIAAEAASGGKVRKPASTTRPDFLNWRLWAIGGSGALTAVVALVILSVSSQYRESRHQLDMRRSPEPDPASNSEGNMSAQQLTIPGGPTVLNSLTTIAPGVVAQSKDRDEASSYFYDHDDSAQVPIPTASSNTPYQSDSPGGGRSAKSEPINGGGGGAPIHANTSPASVAPMIARTVSLVFVVKDVAVARAALDGILARHEAYAAGLTIGTPEAGPRSLQASLRIPAPELPRALAELRSLGHVQSETQSGEEVTQQHADLLARLKNSRETEQRLKDILAQRTGKIDDVLQVEEEIARVRGEIEGMEADQQTLEHRVDFASVDLQIGEIYTAQLISPTPSVANQVRNAFIAGLRHAGDMVLGIVLFVEEAGPALLIWLAILAFPAWRLWKRYRRLRGRA